MQIRASAQRSIFYHTTQPPPLRPFEAQHSSARTPAGSVSEALLAEGKHATSIKRSAIPAANRYVIGSRWPVPNRNDSIAESTKMQLSFPSQFHQPPERWYPSSPDRAQTKDAHRVQFAGHLSPPEMQTKCDYTIDTNRGENQRQGRGESSSEREKRILAKERCAMSSSVVTPNTGISGFVPAIASLTAGTIDLGSVPVTRTAKLNHRGTQGSPPRSRQLQEANRQSRQALC